MANFFTFKMNFKAYAFDYVEWPEFVQTPTKHQACGFASEVDSG